jgi:hypothetical protein
MLTKCTEETGLTGGQVREGGLRVADHGQLEKMTERTRRRQ